MARAVDVERADDVLEFLVRDHAADEHHVGPVVVERRRRASRSGATSRWVKSGTTGSTPVSGKPSALELVPVVFRIAEREIAAGDVGGQLAPPAEAELDQVLVDADEVLGRRDVVVDEHHPARQRVGRARRPRADREVMDEHVLGGHRRRPCRDSRASGPRGADPRSRRRSTTRTRPRAARAESRALRGRWRRRSRASQGPGGRVAFASARWSCRVLPG